MRDLSSGFVFCQCIGIVQRVVCNVITRWLGRRTSQGVEKGARELDIPITASSAMTGNLPVLSGDFN